MSSTCASVRDSRSTCFEAVSVFSTFWSFSTVDRPDEDEAGVSAAGACSGCTEDEALCARYQLSYRANWDS